MEKYGSIPEILLFVALLSVGVLLFLVIRKVIEQMGIFRGRRAGVTAFSIACLIVASIAMLLLVPGDSAENGHDRWHVNFAVLPGVAVAGTIILLQLFVIAASLKPDRTDQVPLDTSASKPVKSKSPGESKKSERNRPPVTQKSGPKEKGGAKASTVSEGATRT